MSRRRRHRAAQILQILQIVVRSLRDRRPDALRLGQLGKVAAGRRVTVAAIGRVLVAAGSFVVVNARANAIAGIYARRRFLEEKDRCVSSIEYANRTTLNMQLVITEDESMRAAPELLCTTPDDSLDFPGE